MQTACGGDDELREEVEALLEYSDDASGLDQPAIAAGVEIIDQSDAASMVGRTIGRYCIEALIGEGGVGSVYRASLADGDFEQSIAIKILKRGMDSGAILRRFRDERRILARLNHPNIAKFLDGGITDDGRPYFVMEYLEGTPIHDYCRSRHLSVRERIELLLPICSAVAYSHQNLVIHRDLKATNILVTSDGTPKLLDFGIAKLLDSDTSHGAVDATAPIDRMMTPDYASPEQVLGNTATTAADVYSLGVLLYELLTDRRPYRLNGMHAAEIARALESGAPKPSTVAPPERGRDIAGDLDVIVAKAMHRMPERRYASAQQFADDLRRHLAGLPVHARPDTIGYRLRKYASRNRAGVFAVSLSTVAISVALLAAVWQSGVAATKELEARKRFSEVRDLANGLLGEVDTSLENLPGATAARELLARKVLHYLDVLARDEVRDATLQRDLANAYERLGEILGGSKASNLGQTGAAVESFRKGLAILDKIAPEQSNEQAFAVDRARMLSKYSDLLAVTGDLAGALAHEQKALAIREEWLRKNPNDRRAKRAVANSLQELAGDLDRAGKYNEVLAKRRQVLAIYEDLDRTAPEDPTIRLALALANKRLGRILMRLHQINEATFRFERAISIERAEVARDPVRTSARAGLAFSLNDLAMALAEKGEYQTAVATFHESLRLRTELAEADKNDWRAWNLLASTRFHLGRVLCKRGDWRSGMDELRQAHALREDLFARSPKNAGARAEVAESAAALADQWAARGNRVQSLPLYRQAFEIYSDLQSKGSLSAELAGEPARIAAAMR